MRRAAVALLATMAISPALAADDSVDNAFALCRVIDSTGMSSQPCDVSGWKSQVIATLDMNSREARTLCTKIADMMREKGRTFGERWTLQIKSPYSGGNSIAFCKL